MASKLPLQIISALAARRRLAKFAGLQCEQLESRVVPALFNVQSSFGSVYRTPTMPGHRRLTATVRRTGS